MSSGVWPFIEIRKSVFNVINAGDRENTVKKEMGPLDFLPAATCRTRFYRYNGSLTTPLCEEVAVWTVFADPIELSSQQLEKLRKAKYLFVDNKRVKEDQMVNNFRGIQPLYGRQVLRSFNDSTPCSGASGLRALALWPLPLALLLLALTRGALLWRL